MRFVAIAVLVACSAPAPRRVPVTPGLPQPAQPTQPAQPPADAPVSGDLGPAKPTLRLPKNFVAKSYTASLSINPAQPGFAGAIQITGEVSARSSVIWLHGRNLTIKKATASRDGAAPTELVVKQADQDLLELRSAAPIEPGAYVISIDYAGTFATVETAGAFVQVSGKSRYVITQFEALFARLVFPCIDEPDSKVPWQLTLDVPAKQVAVSNTPIAKESALPDGRRHVEFERTLPLPAYLVAFAVGPFDVVDAGKTKRGIPIRILALQGRAKDAAYAASVTARIADMAEAWFEIPYPYAKLDMVTIPISVGFSAMENAGMITVTESEMLFDPQKISWANKHAYVSTAAHEIAHQWFGDLVTMVWWDDIWLNEGFASWLENKLTAQFEPAWHEELSDLDTRARALGADSIVTARRVREPIVTEDDIANVFDWITYLKGATVLNMFEAYVGAEKFQRGVREYIKTRAMGNATSTDFIAAISKAGGVDVSAGFSSFLDQGGAPEIEFAVTCGKGKPRVELAQQRYVGPGSPAPEANKPWIVPVCIAFDNAGKRGEACTLMSTETTSLELDAKACPRWVAGNANGRGMYRTRYTLAQATALRDEAWPQLTWTERRAVFAAVKTGTEGVPRTMKKSVSKKPPAKLPLALALSFVPRMLAGGDRFTIGDATDLAGGFDWDVPEGQRAKYESWIRATFGAGAAKVGLVAKPDDDLDAETVRKKLLGLVAWTGRDPDLTKQATDLAAGWRDMASATRGLVLKIGADSTPDLHAKLMRDIYTEQDRARRGEMYYALAGVRDAKRYEAALELTLDPKLDFRESDTIIVAFSTEPMRQVAERFTRVHADALMQRMPKESATGEGRIFIRVATRSCDESKHDEIEKFLRGTIGKLPGGKRSIDQGMEELDQCIAYRKVIVPELEAWLSGVKLPKPAKP
ncbi:MAG TPA: M1 family aminopeptidase [Kofleriaceae bacterium]|nr:M1 family aminopeptidase [Kofleriaceae bacterium]